MSTNPNRIHGLWAAVALIGAAPLWAATVSYQYDALDRLTGVAYADGSVITYAYDAAGNRTQKVASPDTDGDGLLDLTDPDDDNDGVLDPSDAFPLNPAEWLDTDGDGVGNNADPDDDNDGFADAIDPDPLDPSSVPPAHIAAWQPTTATFLLDSDGSDGWSLGDTTITGFGSGVDLPVAGDWNGDGIDEIGVWVAGTLRFRLDANANDTWDDVSGGDTLTAVFGLVGDRPVAGDWNGDGLSEVGVWRPSTRRFLLDNNGNGRWDGVTGGDTLTAAFGLETDRPITGDWNGDGRDDVGFWRPDTRRFYLDTNGNDAWDGTLLGDTLTPAFGLATDLPVIGDWNGDGTDDVGVWRPSIQRFLLDTNGNDRWDGTLGGDTLTAPFGLATDLPLGGRW